MVELDCEDEEIRLRAKHLRLDPEDGQVYSRWERAERNKPKPVELDADGNPIEPEVPEDGEGPKKLIEADLVQRVQDTDSFVTEELQHYAAAERPALDDMIVRLHNHQYLKLDAAGRTPEALADSAGQLLRPDETVPLRPVPIQPEAEAGDFKALLTDPMGENVPEGLPRTYSLWAQTDPVALHAGKVLPGAAGQAVCYANNMFAFASEENMAAFVKEPKKYLAAPPKMPSTYRVMMLGPRGIGVHTQAAQLHAQYGWTVVDYPALVRDRLTAILKEEEHASKEDHMPNNVIPGTSKVGLSYAEIEEIRSGKPFPAWKFIPWILDHLGHRLMQRPPPPDPDEGIIADDLSENSRAAYDARQKQKQAGAAAKAKAAAEAKQAREARRRQREEALAAGADPAELEESADEKPEDLSIEDLVLATDEETDKAPFVGGFTLLGFPQTELHA